MNKTPANTVEPISNSANPVQNITPPINAVITSTVLDGTPKKKNYFLWILGILALMLVMTISFLILTSKSKSTPAGSDMSSWKTYTNPSLGIALQYPSNWALNMDDQNATLTIKADPIDRSPGIEISSLNRQNYISLDHWLAQKDKECEEGKQLAEKTGGDSDCVVYSRLGERKINQFASSKVLWNCCGSGPTIRYFIEGPDKIYLVDLFPDDWRNDKLNAAGNYDEGSSKLAKIYQQILSTFKFTNAQTESVNNNTNQLTKPSEVPATINDPELIEFVRGYLKRGTETPFTIEKVEGNYAYGTGGTENASGFYWAAAKKEGQWNYAFGGNGIPSCSEVEIFPVGTFGGKFDECYEGQKMINRNNSD